MKRILLYIAILVKSMLLKMKFETIYQETIWITE